MLNVTRTVYCTDLMTGRILRYRLRNGKLIAA